LWIAIPILWTAQEYLRSFLFTGFPYLFMGHSQAFHPTLIQIADISGVYGVTFLILLVNTTLWTWIPTISPSYTTRRQKIVATCFSIFLVLSTIVYGQYRLQTIQYDQGPLVASIQGNVPQYIKNDMKLNKQHILESYNELTVQALEQKPSMIIWPETMAAEDMNIDADTYALFHDVAKQTNTTLLIGSHHYEIDYTKRIPKVYNTAYYINTQGQQSGQYHKNRLVIAGEYVPLRNIFPFMPTLIRNLVGYVPDLAESNEKPIFHLQDNVFGCSICYDIAHSSEICQWRRKNAQFIVNLTNEGWFYNTSEPEQLFAISIFRAVENRIGIVRTTNTGITCHIPPTGKVTPEHILHISLQEYPSTLQKYLQKETLHQNVIAWHHLPFQIPFTTQKYNWDFQSNNEKLKWKDFPGIFVSSVPLATKNAPLFTYIGELFAQILFTITILYILYAFYQNIHKKDSACRMTT
ncbi:MAG TPA: apolipoprotein N-acyltransferase, partial [Planctomycetota bacterium]|nr:apolipoprotein N-acyltransferase [Planctomycetota bacterium]